MPAGQFSASYKTDGLEHVASTLKKIFFTAGQYQVKKVWVLSMSVSCRLSHMLIQVCISNCINEVLAAVVYVFFCSNWLPINLWMIKITHDYDISCILGRQHSQDAVQLCIITRSCAWRTSVYTPKDNLLPFFPVFISNHILSLLSIPMFKKLTLVVRWSAT